MPFSPRRALLVVLAFALLVGPGLPGPAAAQQAPYWTESTGATVPADIQRLNDFMNGLAERMKPALVQVRVRRPADPDSAPSVPTPGQPNPDERRASGSGFIIRQDGYLVTNAHVVEEAERIQIQLYDGRRFAGRVVGFDNRVDLALVKIDATALPVALLGDSNRLRVGEFVLALGHPFGLEQTVSFGIVSRKGAPLDVAAPGFDFIQTDAAVNPGNSGGPLVNMLGQVIGVNSAIATTGGTTGGDQAGNIGVGFAIPIEQVKVTADQILRTGEARYPVIGAKVQTGQRDGSGAEIDEVIDDTPADTAGLEKGDVVVALEGQKVTDGIALIVSIRSHQPGETLTFTVLRDGDEKDLDVTLDSEVG
jgi:putative serine protease PepD